MLSSGRYCVQEKKIISSFGKNLKWDCCLWPDKIFRGGYSDVLTFLNNRVNVGVVKKKKKKRTREGCILRKQTLLLCCWANARKSCIHWLVDMPKWNHGLVSMHPPAWANSTDSLWNIKSDNSGSVIKTSSIPSVACEHFGWVTFQMKWTNSEQPLPPFLHACYYASFNSTRYQVHRRWREDGGSSHLLVFQSGWLWKPPSVNVFLSKLLGINTYLWNSVSSWVS